MDCADGYVGYNRSIRSRERHDEGFSPTAGSRVPAPVSQKSAGLGAGQQIVLMHNVVGVEETLPRQCAGSTGRAAPAGARYNQSVECQDV